MRAYTIGFDQTSIFLIKLFLEEVTQLKKFLFANYDKDVRPLENTGKAVIIQTKITVGILVDLVGKDSFKRVENI